MDDFIADEARKLAVQWAAVEIGIEDKLRASERRIISAVTAALDDAVAELRGAMRGTCEPPVSE